MIPARTVVLAILSAAGIAVAVRLSPDGPWTLALLSVGAGVALAWFSTRTLDALAVPAGALGGVLLVAAEPVWLAAALFATAAYLPRIRRAGSGMDAACVAAFAFCGGAAAPLLAAAPAESAALGAAAALLAGVALAAPTIVAEATPEALALRGAARGLGNPAGPALRRSAVLAERIARSEAAPGFKDRAREVAEALAEDGRALRRIAEIRRLETGGSRIFLEGRSEDMVARVVRMTGSLERAWLGGEVPPIEPRVRAVRELEDEVEAQARANESVARIGEPG